MMDFIGKAPNIQQEMLMKCSVQSGEVSVNVFEACVRLGTVLGKSVREAGRGATVSDLWEPTITCVHQASKDSRAS